MVRKAGRKKKTASSAPIAGRYRMLRSLGIGGGGAVYLVMDMMAGERLVALKKVEGDGGGSAADLKNEFATLSLLHHPNLAAVYDFGVTEDGMYFTSEWVDGRDILQATLPADLNTVFQLLVQTLRALDYLHQRGVLHLDLKPANILVTDPNRTGGLAVKVIDFGIALWKKHGRTQEAGFSGSPPYSAPELLEEKEPTPAADIYSLGMILHQVFAGRFPFPKQNPLEILMRQTYEDPQPAEQLDAALPPEFAGLLHRMVARVPEARFQSAREVLEEINRCLGENFSLRSPQAPAHPLEESDHLFHPEILKELASKLANQERIELAGPPGAGKTRLMERLKAQLQLQGLRPLHFRDASDWEDFLRHPSGALNRPILLDLEAATQPRGGADSKLASPLIWTSQTASPQGAWGETVLIPELDVTKLKQFFQTEIQGAPPSIAQDLLQTSGPISPGKLEEILEGFRTEGDLLWGSGGWTWEGEGPIDGAGLLQRKSARDEAKKKEVREFLAASGLALPTSVLEGMLGFEAGALKEFLRAWTREGWLQAETEKGVTSYRTAASREEIIPRDLEDLENVAPQLELLYEQGKFAAGGAWFGELLKRAGSKAIPPRLALAGGRHWVAEGKAESTLGLLEKFSSSDPQQQGLLFETRARAENHLERFEQAKADLDESEKFYRLADSGSGLARVYNLRGNIARAEGRWREAEENLQKAVPIAAAAGDLYCAGTAQTNLGLILQEQGKIEAAYDAYQRAWEFARQNPHPLLLQSLYNKWISLLHHSGRSAEAEAACYEWMKLAIRHRYRDQQAIALNYLSLIAGKREHRELKAAYLDKAIDLLDGAKHPRFLAQFLVNRAYLHWSLGKYLPAQLDGESALKLGARWPHDRVLGFVYLILGKVYRDRPKPDLERSVQFFEQAHSNVLKNQNLQSLWEVEYNRGLLSKAKGERAQARQYFSEAKRALEEFLERLPEALRGSYLRDRKLEAVNQELAALGEG